MHPKGPNGAKLPVLQLSADGWGRGRRGSDAALITDRTIRRDTFLSVREPEQAIYDWLAKWNRDPQPFVWTATADVILDKLKRRTELSAAAHCLRNIYGKSRGICTTRV
jgi:hypothetical protein